MSNQPSLVIESRFMSLIVVTLESPKSGLCMRFEKTSITIMVTYRPRTLTLSLGFKI